MKEPPQVDAVQLSFSGSAVPLPPKNEGNVVKKAKSEDVPVSTALRRGALGNQFGQRPPLASPLVFPFPSPASIAIASLEVRPWNKLNTME